MPAAHGTIKEAPGCARGRARSSRGLIYRGVFVMQEDPTPEQMELVRQFSIRHYKLLSSLLLQMINALEGVRPQDERLLGCNQLAGKIFIHAISIYHLYQGTKVSLLYRNRPTDFVDFSSIAVLVRVGIETYLNMHELYFQVQTDDDFEFNHALWELAGFIIREDVDIVHRSGDAYLQQEHQKALTHIAELRNRIENTARFQSLSTNQQKQVMQGRRGSKIKEATVKSAGMDYKLIQMVYAYFSAYTHGDALSGIQLMNARSRAQQLQHADSFMTLMLIVISKTVRRMAEKFPEARAVADRHKYAFSWSLVWGRDY